MILSVSSQAYAFILSVAGGMVIALVYDAFRVFRKAVKTGRIVTNVQDLLYWLIVSVIMFLTLFFSNDGELRAYLFVGAFLGVVLYTLLFSKIVMGSSLFIIRIATTVVKAMVRFISIPVKCIIKYIKRMRENIKKKSDIDDSSD
jgi:spore cortex biosynthesis protein YabQ